MKKSKRLILVKTCNACPSQWSGTTENGKPVYIRYRWGWFSFEVNGIPIHEKRLGDSLDGFIDNDQLKDILKKQNYKIISMRDES